MNHHKLSFEDLFKKDLRGRWIRIYRERLDDQPQELPHYVTAGQISGTKRLLADTRFFDTNVRLVWNRKFGWVTEEYDNQFSVFYERHREFYVGPFESDEGIFWLKEWPGSTNPRLATLFRIYPRRWHPGVHSMSYKDIELVRSVVKELQPAGV